MIKPKEEVTGMHNKIESQRKKNDRNPFVYFEPVKGIDFSNREEIIEDISKIVFGSKQQGNVWITGIRQVGKTSLLQQIERIYRENPPRTQLYGTEKEFKILFVYFNCQLFRDDNGFYRGMSQCLANHFDFKIPDSGNTYDLFKDWIKETYNAGYYIVFLLDEFDAFIDKYYRQSPDDATHFLDTINVIKQDFPGFGDRTKAFGLVCASNSSFGELTANMNLSGSGFVISEEIELPYFGQDQVSALVDEYLKDNIIQFSEDEIEFCFKMTHGYPLFTQKLLSIMYEEKSKRPGEKTDKIISTVKKEFGKAFLKIIEDWDKQKKLTDSFLHKLKPSEELKDSLKDFSSSVLAKIINGVI